MNTAGIKGYTCPKCKKPFTRLERSTFSVVLGVVIIFFSIPGILFGILFVLAPDGSEIAKWIFLIAPTLFALYGLNCMRGKLCPNCGIRLRKVGDMYIAPGGINKLTASEALKSAFTARTNSTASKPETIYQPMVTKTSTGTWEHICPACGLPYTEPVLKRSIRDIFFGIILFTVGLFLIGFGLWLILTSGEFHDPGKLMAVAMGIAFALVGLLTIFQANTEQACPNCGTRL